MKHHPEANCEECPLFENNTFCPSDGPREAELVIVGEAPNHQEVRKQLLFIGSGGQLLNMVLEHNGFDRRDVFVTNTVLCQPEKKAKPNAAAIKACRPRLVGEINLRDPDTIVALGGPASKSILKTNEGITTLRTGPSKVSPDYPGVRIIPTFHPAASLYNPGVFPDIISDFQKIRRPNVSSNWSPPEFVVLDDRNAIDGLKELLRKGNIPISVDIEIGIDKDLNDAHPEEYAYLCVGICYAPGRVLVLDESSLQRQDVFDTLRIVLEQNKIIAHNGKFDLQGLFRVTTDARLWFDTMLASYVTDERAGVHSLEYNSIERLGSPSWKAEVSGYLGPTKNYAAIPRKILYRYNAWDAHNTYMLWQLYEKELDVEQRALHDHLVDASNMLMFVEHNGVGVDIDYLDTLTEEYTSILEELRSKLQQQVEDGAYNPNSWQQVTRVLKEEFNTRVPNTQADTLTDLMERSLRKGNKDLYDFLRTHLEYKKEAKAYGTYVKGTRKRLYRGRVHSTYKLHGTTTGRLSSANPNLQNVTRGSRLRTLFIPRTSDNVLGQSDYRQAELRVVCTLAKDTYLKSVFDDDSRSIHVEVARQFYGDDFDRVRDKEKYIRAKAVVFGLTYGREAFSLAAEYKMSIKQAEEYIKTFFAMIPQTQEWRESVLETIHSGQDLVSPFGNHRRFWLITNENKNNVEKEALAFYPQNIVSNILLKAGISLAKQGLQDMLRIPIHDAWLFECPESDAEEIGHMVAETMEDAAREHFTDYVKFPCDVGFGKTWGDIE